MKKQVVGKFKNDVVVLTLNTLGAARPGELDEFHVGWARGVHGRAHLHGTAWLSLVTDARLARVHGPGLAILEKERSGWVEELIGENHAT